MDIAKRVRHDHAELRSLAQRILQSSDGKDPGSRGNSFKLYNTELRRHLDVFEDVFVSRMNRDAQAGDAAADILAEHKQMRKALSRLNRRGKDTPEWTREFEALSARFESLCSRHEALVTRTSTVHDSAQLDHHYALTAAKRSRSSSGWSRAAIGLGAAGVVAGLAYFGRRYVETPRARSQFKPQAETSGPDIVVVEATVVEVTPIPDTPPQPTPSFPRAAAVPPTPTTDYTPPRQTTPSPASSSGAPTRPEQTPATDEHTTELTGSAHPTSDYNLSATNAAADRH